MSHTLTTPTTATDDTQNSLCDELLAYCKAQGLPHASADDLLASLYPETPELDTIQAAGQREWLLDFVDRWNACVQPSKPYPFGTIGHVLAKDDEMRLAMAPEVLALNIADGCGADCFRLITAARALLEALPDVEAEHREAIAAAAGRQCCVFYFG